MSGQNALGALVFVAFVVGSWNVRRLTRWYNKTPVEGSIAEPSQGCVAPLPSG